MSRNEKYPELITAEEAVKLGRKEGRIGSINRAVNIYQEWKKEPQYPDSPGYDFWCMLATIYDAGRIQGIREERQRRNNT